MGNRTGLWLGHGDTETMVFEANNVLPVFWCALFTPGDCDPLIEAEEGARSLELQTGWPAALRCLDTAEAACPADWAARFRAFAASVRSAAARLRAETVRLDAVEWGNFYSQDSQAAAALGALVGAWHGTHRPPTLHSIWEADGEACDSAQRRAQAGWPDVPVAALPATPAPPGAAAEWAWVVALVGVAIGLFALTRSVAVAAAGLVVAFGVFLWRSFR